MEGGRKGRVGFADTGGIASEACCIMQEETVANLNTHACWSCVAKSDVGYSKSDVGYSKKSDNAPGRVKNRHEFLCFFLVLSPVSQNHAKEKQKKKKSEPPRPWKSRGRLEHENDPMLACKNNKKGIVLRDAMHPPSEEKQQGP